MKKLSVFVLATVFAVGPVMAGEKLSGDEIKALFADKTFDIHNLEKDKRLKGYSAADGSFTVYIPWKDKTSERKWWVDGDKHCTSHPKRGDLCKVIKHHGDGVYHGYKDGELVRSLSNFQDGNQL